MVKEIHPDDAMLFNEVATAMRRVAKRYDLPVAKISHTSNPRFSRALGYCHWNHDIEITIRVKEGGRWTEGRLSTDEVWDTAAHELAHLRHMNHGEEFWAFHAELVMAMTTEKKDEKDKVLDKIIKLQKMGDAEQAVGNAEAAQSFAAKVNKLLLDNELEATDLAYARSSEHDPVIEKRVDFGLFGMKSKRGRVGWQEALAQIIARAHLCQILINSKCNDIWFVGTKSHAEVAEYVFGTLAPALEIMSDKEAYFYRLKMNREKTPRLARGFRESWLAAFVLRLGQRLEEAKREAIRDAVSRGAATQQTAMVRLEGALIKVAEHIDRKFKPGKAKAIGLGSLYGNHAGREAGRAAADRLDIGKKAIGTKTVKGFIE